MLSICVWPSYTNSQCGAIHLLRFFWCFLPSRRISCKISWGQPHRVFKTCNAFMSMGRASFLSFMLTLVCSSNGFSVIFLFHVGCIVFSDIIWCPSCQYIILARAASTWWPIPFLYNHADSNCHDPSHFVKASSSQRTVNWWSKHHLFPFSIWFRILGLRVYPLHWTRASWIQSRRWSRGDWLPVTFLEDALPCLWFFFFHLKLGKARRWAATRKHP